MRGKEREVKQIQGESKPEAKAQLELRKERRREVQIYLAKVTLVAVMDQGCGASVVKSLGHHSEGHEFMPQQHCQASLLQGCRIVTYPAL